MVSAKNKNKVGDDSRLVASKPINNGITNEHKLIW